MKSFIGNICKLQRTGELDCNDSLPPPPFPPDQPDNPNHFSILTDNGLGAATKQFTSGSGAIAVRIFGRNNANSDPGITAKITQGGIVTKLTPIGETFVGTVDTSFCAMYAGFLAPNVQATLSFELTGSAGRAWVRLGDFAHLPADFDALSRAWPSYENSDGTTNNYYVDIVPQEQPGSLMLSTVGWLNATAAPITSTGDYEQFNGSFGVGVAGAAAFFGAIESPGGEPGWGGYVWEINGGFRKPNGLLVAITGATLPDAV